MPTFTKTITDSAGDERRIERTTDAPGEITSLRSHGWAEVPEKAPEKAAEAPATVPALAPKAPGPKAPTKTEN